MKRRTFERPPKSGGVVTSVIFFEDTSYLELLSNLLVTKKKGVLMGSVPYTKEWMFLKL